MIPSATMRLQLHAGFTFAEVIRIAPYLSRLGISHLYASPITAAKPGSMHGYDVVDPTRVNPELGGEEGLRRMIAELRRLGLGLIVDIVPNHMFVGDGANPWWEDVLAHGQDSRWAKIFDIDWHVSDPELRGKVLLPILGAPYGEVLESGALKLIEKDGVWTVDCQGRPLPINAKGRELTASSGSETERVHRVLEAQHYRLAWWRVAGDEINWRRFFEINELAGVRVEDDEVFDVTHALALDLYAQGLIDGVRVDHIDGLANPGAYCRRLRKRLQELAADRPPHAPDGNAYFVVEKILAPGERLPDGWGVDGTSGYDFMDQVSAVLHDPRGEAPLTQLWTEISGRTASFEDEARSAREELLERSFSAQLDGTASALHRVARANLTTRDISRASIRRVVGKLISHFPAYRTYAAGAGRSAGDTERFGHAAKAASISCLPQDRHVISHLDRWLGGEPAEDNSKDLCNAAIARFEQLCAPIAAKAVEDTAFYRYGRLLSRTDVGFDVARFAMSPEVLHNTAIERQRSFPAAMLATATHDHKRGEDVRARLAVLSELADEWATSVRRWMLMNSPLRRTVEGQAAPSPGDEAMLYQMIVGAWPLRLSVEDRSGRSALCERLCAWLEKALREAKLVTEWTLPNQANEEAAKGFLSDLLDSDRPIQSLTEIAAFAHRIGPSGAINGLTQTILKMTCPGVPDFYQGTELWDQSLVDPDNRSPVDFNLRETSMDQEAELSILASEWRDGRVKQAVIQHVMGYRRAHPRIFSDGAHLPLNVFGKLAENVIAYARIFSGDAVIVVACRLPARLKPSEGDLRIATSLWDDTYVLLPAVSNSPKVRDLLTGKTVTAAAQIKVRDVLDALPIAVLVPDSAA